MRPVSTAATRRSSHHDHADPILGDPDLGADLDIGITALMQVPDLLHEVYRTMLATCDVLDEAHHKAVGFRSLYDDCRNFRLAQHPEGFDSTFAAYEVVARRPG